MPGRDARALHPRPAPVERPEDALTGVRRAAEGGVAGAGEQRAGAAVHEVLDRAGDLRRQGGAEVAPGRAGVGGHPDAAVGDRGEPVVADRGVVGEVLDATGQVVEAEPVDRVVAVDVRVERALAETGPAGRRRRRGQRAVLRGGGLEGAGRDRVATAAAPGGQRRVHRQDLVVGLGAQGRDAGGGDASSEVAQAHVLLADLAGQAGGGRGGGRGGRGERRGAGAGGRDRADGERGCGHQGHGQREGARGHVSSGDGAGRGRPV